MENRKHTSLKDLAQALGVSIPTVSRALKDSPEISRELCTKAKALAKEMNYRPNPFAMSLRKNAPRIIGVIVPDIVTHFFASILNGIENMAIANGYFVIITTSHESYEHEKRNIENLVNMRVEGIIACLSQETTDFSHISALKDINMPLILFDRVCLTDQFSSVIADGAQSAQMATQHLPVEGFPVALFRFLLLSTSQVEVLLFYHPYTEKRFFRQTYLNPVSTLRFLSRHSQQPDTRCHRGDVPRLHIFPDIRQ